LKNIENVFSNNDRETWHTVCFLSGALTLSSASQHSSFPPGGLMDNQ